LYFVQFGLSSVFVRFFVHFGVVVGDSERLGRCGCS
jgi:hypothetical protein